MRAAYYDRYGPARSVLEVGELPDPEPSAGEVLVRVHASGVNPTDTKTRGRGEGPTPERIVPHQDGAGIIQRVGPGVDPQRVGERVWVYFAQWRRTSGTAAEFVALPAHQAVRLPEGVSFPEGACLGIPALTAAHCVNALAPLEGETVLVTGGAGAVGWYACAFARRAGATVVASVSDDAKAVLARRAGAHQVTDYAVSTLADGSIDRMIDVAFGANLSASVRVLRPGATIATYASDAVRDIAFRPLLMAGVTVHFILVYLLRPAQLEAAVTLVSRSLEEGLAHNVGRRFGLDETAAAHEEVESGARGNVVIDL